MYEGDEPSFSLHKFIKLLIRFGKEPFSEAISE